METSATSRGESSIKKVRGYEARETAHGVVLDEIRESSEDFELVLIDEKGQGEVLRLGTKNGQAQNGTIVRRTTKTMPGTVRNPAKTMPGIPLQDEEIPAPAPKKPAIAQAPQQKKVPQTLSDGTKVSWETQKTWKSREQAVAATNIYNHMITTRKAAAEVFALLKPLIEKNDDDMYKHTFQGEEEALQHLYGLFGTLKRGVIQVEGKHDDVIGRPSDEQNVHKGRVERAREERNAAFQRGIVELEAKLQQAAQLSKAHGKQYRVFLSLQAIHHLEHAQMAEYFRLKEQYGETFAFSKTSDEDAVSDFDHRYNEWKLQKLKAELAEASARLVRDPEAKIHISLDNPYACEECMPMIAQLWKKGAKISVKGSKEAKDKMVGMLRDYEGMAAKLGQAVAKANGAPQKTPMKNETSQPVVPPTAKPNGTLQSKPAEQPAAAAVQVPKLPAEQPKNGEAKGLWGKIKGWFGRK